MERSLKAHSDGPFRAGEEALTAACDTARPAADRHLAEAVEGLRSRTPEYSAAAGLWPWQGRALGLALIALCAGLLLAPETSLVALLAIMAFPFFCVVLLRVIALWQLQASLPRRARGRCPERRSAPRLHGAGPPVSRGPRRPRAAGGTAGA
ncbi:MAG: hypothetical protein WDN31_07375 [Hyphomicrobium sp.]